MYVLLAYANVHVPAGYAIAQVIIELRLKIDEVFIKLSHGAPF
jgi:hypothetical protein